MNILVLIFRGWVASRAHGTVWCPGKNPQWPGIDPGTLRLVAQCLHHYAGCGDLFELNVKLLCKKVKLVPFMMPIFSCFILDVCSKHVTYSSPRCSTQCPSDVSVRTSYHRFRKFLSFALTGFFLYFTPLLHELWGSVWHAARLLILVSTLLHETMVLNFLWFVYR
jgi:hypothetical protein